MKIKIPREVKISGRRDVVLTGNDSVPWGYNILQSAENMNMISIEQKMTLK